VTDINTQTNSDELYYISSGEQLYQLWPANGGWGCVGVTHESEPAIHKIEPLVQPRKRRNLRARRGRDYTGMLWNLPRCTSIPRRPLCAGACRLTYITGAPPPAL